MRSFETPLKLFVNPELLPKVNVLSDPAVDAPLLIVNVFPLTTASDSNVKLPEVIVRVVEVRFNRTSSVFVGVPDGV